MTHNYILRAAMAVVLFCVILSGCSNRAVPSKGSSTTLPSPAKSLTLNFVYASGDPTTNQATHDVVDAFNKSQSNIYINETPSTLAGTYDNYLKTKEAVDEFPDFLDMRDTQTYADAGKLALLPQEIVDLLEDPATVNGKVYTAPMLANTPLGIIYNKAIFAKAGITEDPKTWDEFLMDCQKIKDLGISPIVVGGRDLWHMSFWQGFFFGNYLFADNQNWNADKKSGKAHFTDANVVNAMKDMTELWTKGYVDKNWLSTADNQVASVLISGKAAMLYEGSWMFNTIHQLDPTFKVGFFAPPDRKGRIITLGRAVQGFALSAKAAQEPEKVAGFIEFMKFFYSNANYTKYLQVSNGVAATKAKITYDAPEEMQKLVSIYNDPKTIKVMLMHNYWGPNQIPTEFRDWLWKLSQQWLLTGNPSVEDAMKLADAEFDKDMANEKQ